MICGNQILFGARLLMFLIAFWNPFLFCLTRRTYDRPQFRELEVWHLFIPMFFI